MFGWSKINREEVRWSMMFWITYDDLWRFGWNQDEVWWSNWNLDEVGEITMKYDGLDEFRMSLDKSR